MAFREGSAFNGINTNETEVISNDGSMILFDGLPGSFKDPTSTTISSVGRTVWNGGFDYTLLSSSTAFKLTAYDAAASDQYGHSVAVGSGVIIVGSYGDDDNGSASGSAYLYNINGTLISKVKPSDGAAGDNFGWSVAAGSNRIVVGAPGDDDKGGSSGAAYIFNLSGTGQVKLVPADGAASDQFGYSVAIGCNRVVVGAPFDSLGTHTGSAYIYKRDGTLVRKITAPSPEGVSFGSSVAINLGRIIVGDPGGKRQGTDSGSVYIYDLEGNLLKQINSTPISQSIGISSYVTNGTTTVTGNMSFSSTTIPAVGDYIRIFNASSGNESLNGTWKILSRPLSTSFTFAITNSMNSATRTSNIGSTSVVENINMNVTSYVTNGTTTVTANIATNSYIPIVNQYFTISGATNGGEETRNNLWLNGTYRVLSVTSTSFTFQYTSAKTAATRTLNIGSATTIDTAGDAYGTAVSVGSGRIGVGLPNKLYHTTTPDRPSYGIVELYDINGVFSCFASSNMGFIGTNTLRASGTNYSTPLPTTGAKFGSSIGIGSGYVVGGAPLNDVNSVADAGSVFLLNCKTTPNSLSSYSEATATGYLDKNLLSLYGNAATLFPGTTNTASDQFGYSVACGWDTIVIGCPLENTNSGATVDSGAVYVFKIKEKSNGYYEKILDAYGKED